MGRADPRKRMIEMCSAFPEVAVDEGERYVGFKVRKKTFAYYLEDYRDDGRIALVCKVPPGEQKILLESDPKRFYKPAYLGPKGWIALYLDLEGTDWDEVAEFALDSYRLIAPKTLARAVGEDASIH